MNKKPKLVYGIKGKLVSAACMLLVAVIMVVSSTYAWFTLSTAPEVIGIQTAVGANGSLEMALLPTSGSADAVTSAVGDGRNALKDKNITWGNLVDLNDPSYGLNQITLYPSKLNVVGSTLQSAMLQTPVYGADGRVSDLDDNTVTGVYVPGADGGFIPNDAAYGVRAVGVASGMTQRQLDYRNAVSKADTYRTQAANAAASSMNTHGSALATILSTKAMGGTYTDTDVANLLKLVNSIATPLELIEKAYMQYILAYAASAANADETVYTGVKGLVEAENADLDSVLADITLTGTALADPIAALQATQQNVADAKGALEALSSKTTITWEELSPALTKLADIDNITLNDYKANEVQANMSALINKVSKEGARVDMTTGAGVYADIADHCGNYTASVKIEKIEYNNLSLTDLDAKMYATTTLPAAYLVACKTASDVWDAPAGETGSMPITEFYGYVIDLAFRTNAVESNLLLQTAAKDRIYNNNENPDTMGHGSTMTFASTSNSFSNDQVKELMKAIRVVFFQPGSNTIVAYAKLDVDGASVGADGVTANLYLYTTTTTYTTTVGETTYNVTKTGDVYTYNNGEGDVTVDASQVTTTVTETMIENPADAKIMALPQNVATALSALVYLDGDMVQNDDVAATVAQSMTGKLNLQFASSANLVPMEYADLHQPAQGN